VAKKHGINVKDVVWVLAVGSQIGLSIASPVILGLAVGYWLDHRLGSLPWITLLLTLIGTILGPVVAYRWATSMVRQRFGEAGKEPE
jgi:predicted F0F1-ATPase subunit